MSFVPSSERIPGVYQQVQLVREVGLVQGTPKVVLVGWRLTANTGNDEQLFRVRSRSEVIDLAGSGSQLDLMSRAAFDAARLARFDASRGITPEIYVCPVAPVDAGGAEVAEEQTVTVSGTATSAGAATLWVGEESVTVPVAVDDAATDVAAALEAELETVERNLPFTAAVAAAVVTLAAREKGAWGGELVTRFESTADGISAVVAQSAAGSGNVDVSDALDVVLAEGPFSCVIIGEDSSAARTALRSHVRDSWDYTESKYHIGVSASGGDLSDAETAAAAVDDWRVVLANAEKTGSAPIDADDSSRAFSFSVAAAVGTRLFSQVRSNYNFNLAPLNVSGRPRSVQRSVVNDAINGGVTVVLASRSGQTPGEIVDPVSTATTDQTPAATGAPDRTWAPIEIAKVAQVIVTNMQAELLGFSQSAADEQTRLSAKAAALAILQSAAQQGLIAAVDDDAVDARYENVGGATHLVLDLGYDVIVGLDIIAVTHSVTRALV